MKEFAFNLWNLFNHDRRTAYMPDGRAVTYALDSKWQVREVKGDILLFETDAAISLCAWLNNNRVSVEA